MICINIVQQRSSYLRADPQDMFSQYKEVLIILTPAMNYYGQQLEQVVI